ncbi:MAG: fructosamine kinase [Melioribacteraceae bacterium]|nr:MAG: fructosamine kinase [Melioribacteraceae bacterium]
MRTEKLSTVLGCPIDKIHSVGGGCIGDSVIAKTQYGDIYFVKSYSGKVEMIKAEYEGLSELAKASVIRIPEVIYHDSDLLILEYIEQGIPVKGFWENFGRAFAHLHQYRSELYGFTADNFIGSTPQINNQSEKWTDFFFQYRIRFQAKLAVKNGFADSSLLNKIDKLEKICIPLIDDVNIVPSLLHGDLWSGNYLVDSAGAPVLIDPAVYYGDREADLAMTKLFGSFGSDFYRAYNETFPLLPGYSERENLYKLYHILNHLNLFGPGYSSQVNSLINFYL